MRGPLDDAGDFRQQHHPSTHPVVGALQSQRCLRAGRRIERLDEERPRAERIRARSNPAIVRMAVLDLAVERSDADKRLDVVPRPRAEAFRAHQRLRNNEAVAFGHAAGAHRRCPFAGGVLVDKLLIELFLDHSDPNVFHKIPPQQSIRWMPSRQGHPPPATPANESSGRLSSVFSRALGGRRERRGMPPTL
jgi:hypothetical protein